MALGFRQFRHPGRCGGSGRVETAWRDFWANPFPSLALNQLAQNSISRLGEVGVLGPAPRYEWLNLRLFRGPQDPEIRVARLSMGGKARKAFILIIIRHSLSLSLSLWTCRFWPMIMSSSRVGWEAAGMDGRQHMRGLKSPHGEGGLMTHQLS